MRRQLTFFAIYFSIANIENYAALPIEKPQLSKFSSPPWVKFESAGWVNIQSALTIPLCFSHKQFGMRVLCEILPLICHPSST